jgi:hypothetical protein
VLDFHPPFCPVYVLHNGLQGSGKRPNKWVRRSRVAINLGHSPRHARSVALVLSLLTGYVSAQFHLKHDDFFETVKDLNALPQSKWLELARFTTDEIEGKPVSRLIDPHPRGGANQQVHFEPDHTPINDDIPEGLIPVQEDNPEPHMPFDPFEDQGGRRLGEATKLLTAGRPPGTIT